jgi:hypothetical protein
MDLNLPVPEEIFQTIRFVINQEAIEMRVALATLSDEILGFESSLFRIRRAAIVEPLTDIGKPAGRDRYSDIIEILISFVLHSVNLT